MLSVQPQRFQLPHDQISMDSAPSVSHMNDSQTHHLGTQKQQQKKSMLSPYKILLGIAVFSILTMITYKVYTQISTPATKSEISSMHGKIIQYADSSSSKEKSSNTGSSSSKSSKSNQRPNLASKPATKSPISSNNNNNAFSSSDQDGDKQDQDQNDGDKNKKILDNGKAKSETKSKSSKFGTSTTEDSESVQSDDQEGFTTEGLMFSDKDDGPTPLIGSTRG